MGRTRKIRKGGQGVGNKRKRSVLNPCNNPDIPSYMALHLKADIQHDHGATVNVNNIIGKPDEGSSLSEDKVYDYILNHVSGEFKQDSLRHDNIVNFQLAEKTDFFPQSGIKPLFSPFNGITNDKVGVVQDAGIPLYRLMNAQNIITFGSVLDQAGKPKENAYFQKAINKILEIDLCIFGFKPSLGKIKISNFTGKTVNYEFGGRGGTIELNKLSGDFLSVADIKNINDDPANKERAIIAKALGDALQVVSLTTEYAGDFYPSVVSPLEGSVSTREIEKVLFNTGDRLAHIRSYMFGVPSVYSAPKDKNGIRSFEYLPGAEVSIDMSKYYSTSMNAIVKNIDDAYTTLLAHLTSVVLPNIQVASTYEDKQLIPPTKVDIAKQYIERLIANVTEIQKRIMLYCNELKTDLSQESYNQLLQEAIHLTPSSTTTFKRGNRSILLTLTLLKPREDIVLKSSGEKLLDKGTYTWNVYETYKKIGEGSKIDDKQMKVFTMFGNEPALPNGLVIGGQKVETVFGIDFSTPTQELKIVKKDPLDEFMKESYLPFASDMSWSEVCEAYETYKLYPPSILDVTLFESLYNEFVSISQEDVELFKIVDKKGGIPVHTKSSLNFNAFACRFNATIAGGDNDFEEYEKTFNEMLKVNPPVDISSGSPPREQVFVSRAPGATLSLNESYSYVGTPTHSQVSVYDEGHSSDSSNPEGKYRVGKRLFGGQRVSLENLNIDSTKSFVKSVGTSPK